MGAPPTPPAPPTPAALTDADVVAFYEALLDRTPRPDEIALQLGNVETATALLQVILASDEYAARRAADAVAAATPARPLVNVHTDDLAEFWAAPGTWSDDGVAVTGRDGWIFLGGGSNAILDQYQGTVGPDEGFDAAWAAAMAERREGAERLGAAFLGLIVPDKLPVLADLFPEPLPGIADVPAARLAARPELGLLYPVAELAAVPGGAFLRTDTHLTYAGNAALGQLVAEGLDARIPDDVLPGDMPLSRALHVGDLGRRYVPQLVEVTGKHHSWGRAQEVESNLDALFAVGGHVGTRTVMRNDTADDARTVVIFGDSYSLGNPAYAGLSWFLAHAFREVHFCWVPFGWDPDYAAAAGADVIVCEGAERFAIRPPDLRVDIHQLAVDTITRLGGDAAAVS
ncbi:hypothetical protein [Baekduia sp.]|uniref:hypothetical protein n=1 Tax=Baekduia sp. TaxID=2600305 RepID=UPI002D7A0B7B|nr:hypothetical protein [Baekduia sp.]